MRIAEHDPERFHRAGARRMADLLFFAFEGKANLLNPLGNW